MLAMAVVGFLSLHNPLLVDRDGIVAGFSSSSFSNPAYAPSKVVLSGGYISGFGYVPFYASGGFSLAGMDVAVFLKGVPASMRVYMTSEDIENATYTFVGEFALGGAVSKDFSLGFAGVRAGVSVMGMFGKAYKYSSVGGGVGFGAVVSFKMPLKVSIVAGPFGYATSYAGNGGYMTASVIELGVKYTFPVASVNVCPVLGFGYRLDGAFSIPLGMVLKVNSLPLSVSIGARLLSTEYVYGVLSYKTPLNLFGGDLGISIGGSYNLFGFSSTVAISVR